MSIANLTLTIVKCAVPKNIEKDQNTGYFDLDKILFPLTIRSWKQGDRFCPLGMAQHKKISDFLIDLKIPLHLKAKVKVLLSGEHIIWVIGYRIDDRYKINKSTTQVLKVSLKIKN